MLTLFLVAGSLSLAACGDDGNVLGSDGNGGRAGQTSGGSAGLTSAGHAGQTSGGSIGQMSGGSGGQTSGGAGGSSSNAGSGYAGSTAGHSNGGSSGGSGGNGGATCEISECLRANVCLDECGGKVLYSGCCACAANTVEVASCNTSGGQGSGGQGNSNCAGMSCGSSQTCVAYRTVGGAIDPPNDGLCMVGKHVESSVCQNDFVYTCAALTGCSAPATTCRCAANSECSNTTVCRLPSAAPWLDQSAALVCELQAP